MNLSESIDLYVRRKRIDGRVFDTGYKTLSGFCRQVGDLELSQVNTQHVLSFLNRTKPAVVTWRAKHSLLTQFFEFFSARGAMPMVLMPPKKPPVCSTFVPHMYTREEIRALIKAIPQSQNNFQCSLDKQTLRSALLFLYATGARIGEVSQLSFRDVDVKKSYITISNPRFQRARRIPICPDLCHILSSYVAFRERKHPQCEHFFVSRDGHPMTAQMLHTSFQRLRVHAGVHGRGDGAGRPRLQDLRATFAVHRIDSWIKKRADLNRLLPALAAYMGLAELTATERYISLSPERFRKELLKLSPQKSRKHWRDDTALMNFLASL
jgi:integrase/recombinase XerD